MKNKINKILLMIFSLVLMLTITSCSSNNDSSSTNSSENVAKTENEDVKPEDSEEKEEPKQDTEDNESKDDTEEASSKKHNVKLKWARVNSGNAMLTVARQKGFLEEVGIEVEDVPVDRGPDAATALETGQIDVYSNFGTIMPLKNIATGSEFDIVGGYMLQ